MGFQIRLIPYSGDFTLRINMKTGIMQPYFFPYIGYFQLMNSVDEFIVYDNIEFSKSGWINRNRILVNGKDDYITLTLKKDSDYLNIKNRYLADDWDSRRNKLLNKIKESYRKAPCFNEVYPFITDCFEYKDRNLFNFLLNSLKVVAVYCGIVSKLIISSEIDQNSSLKAEKRVISICKARNSTTYINAAGGLNLYKKEDFETEGIKLFFLKTGDIVYDQFNNKFVSNLSIIDVMMFNPKERIRDFLSSGFTLI